MLFNSLDFVVFLVVVLSLYYVLATRAQNVLLLGASYFFYGYWDWRFLSLLFASTVIDYWCGLGMGDLSQNARRRRRILMVSLSVNLGLLGLFKYFNFFASSTRAVAAAFGWKLSPLTIDVILPVGISFYTFQTLAYTIDVYRGNLKPVRSLLDFALYVSFFPQLVAGPIERATHLLPQLQQRRSVSHEQWTQGSLLILIGLVRKVAIADVAAEYVNRAFAQPEIFPTSSLWIATFLFSLQIYGDFAGYSDIARGVAMLFGVNLTKNFDQPYFSTNITEFWRRWHISLSTWLRDYLYIPLGGNRHGHWMTYRNLLLTMVLGGLWHGAAWGFVAWGTLHGIYLTLHRAFGNRDSAHTQTEPTYQKLIKRVLLFVLVSVTWVPFRQPDIGRAWDFAKRLVVWRGSLLDLANPGKVLEPGLVLALCLVGLLAIDIPMHARRTHTAMLQWTWLPRAAAYALMLLALGLFGGSDERAFIYFQF